MFVLLMAAVGWFYLQHPDQMWGDYTWLAMAVSLVIACVFICIDILSPRRKVVIFSGTFLGLIVGILIAFALSFVVRLVVQQFQPDLFMTKDQIVSFTKRRDLIEQYINVVVGVTSCYLAISFILQTKDDFRFIIPYVEFSKERRGSRPVVLDTSVLIDGRIAEIATTGILDCPVIVPRFVLLELQAIADSADRLRRNRGRRGLDVLAKLQQTKLIQVILYDTSARDTTANASSIDVAEQEVDQRLMALAKELNARVLTTDFNLNKVAQLRGVIVINVNDVATAVKPVALPGERMLVRVIKPGEAPGQGVGFLDDGTMVVVESARPHLNEEVEFVVTNALQTNTGKMIFGRLVAART